MAVIKMHPVCVAPKVDKNKGGRGPSDKRVPIAFGCQGPDWIHNSRVLSGQAPTSKMYQHIKGFPTEEHTAGKWASRATGEQEGQQGKMGSNTQKVQTSEGNKGQ